MTTFKEFLLEEHVKDDFISVNDSNYMMGETNDRMKDAKKESYDLQIDMLLESDEARKLMEVFVTCDTRNITKILDKLDKLSKSNFEEIVRDMLS